MNHNQQVSGVEHGWEQGVEEEARKQEFSQLHIVPKHADFYLTNQHVVAADILLFNQAQFPQPLQMMKSNAGATKMQGTLNLSDTDGAASF